MSVGIRNYSGRNTESYVVRIGRLQFYFSYETCVAFRDLNGDFHVCENVWGTTTGRHLNEIDGGAKNERLPRDEFKKKLEEFEEKLLTILQM